MNYKQTGVLVDEEPLAVQRHLQDKLDGEHGAEE